MVEDSHSEAFGLPESFVSAFASAHGSDARMKVVEQFFECKEISLGKAGTLELQPNETHQVYLVGSTSLIHIEREGPAGTFFVVQPVPRKQGTIEKSVLEDKIVSEMKKGRKLWLLTRTVPLRPRSDERLRELARESGRLTHDNERSVSASPIGPDEIVPETSSTRLSAVEGASRGGELDVSAFGQLRTMLQNVRLQFWSGEVRSQATESISLAAHKAEEHDITGAIQSIEMVENVFVRLVEQWEHDFREAERLVKRGRGDVGDPTKFKTHKDHHSEMQTRITQAKTKFRIMLNWLREVETKMNHGEQGYRKP
jgi:hypothetical protein